MNVRSLISASKQLIKLNWEFLQRAYSNRRIKPLYVHDYIALPEQVFKECKVVFVLSTGRCGTKLLAKIMQRHPAVRAYHEAFPPLVFPSKLAYEAYERGLPIEVGKLAIIAGRYELIRNAFLQSKIYLETNNRLTFFAPYIAAVFEQAKFIHLVRHPGDFVRSAIRRGYYTGKHSWDEGRIQPLEDGIPWGQMTAIEKNAWLWNETNRFIEKFKKQIESNRVITVRAEDLFSNTYQVIESICKFIGVQSMPGAQVEKAARKPVNVQRHGDFPKYSQWSQEQKAELRKYAKLAQQYGYDI